MTKELFWILAFKKSTWNRWIKESRIYETQKQACDIAATHLPVSAKNRLVSIDRFAVKAVFLFL